MRVLQGKDGGDNGPVLFRPTPMTTHALSPVSPWPRPSHWPFACPVSCVAVFACVTGPCHGPATQPRL